jgi:hypothetical protein
MTGRTRDLTYIQLASWSGGWLDSRFEAEEDEYEDGDGHESSLERAVADVCGLVRETFSSYVLPRTSFACILLVSEPIGLDGSYL